MRKAEHTNKRTGKPWWLTVRQFAEITQRSEAAVRTSIARGELPALKLGRKWFIDAAHIQSKFDAAARAIGD